MIDTKQSNSIFSQLSFGDCFQFDIGMEQQVCTGYCWHDSIARDINGIAGGGHILFWLVDLSWFSLVIICSEFHPEIE